ncbi:MAG: rod shape-determining protein RodA [Armatimonas sp.]
MVRFDPRRLRDIDWMLLLLVAIIALIGVAAIHFADPLSTEGHKNVVKQLIALGVGTVVMGVITFTDYRNLSRTSLILYWVAIAMLVIVLKVGHEAKGASRWIKLPGGFTLQPSEIAKFVTILAVGNFLVRVGEAIKQPKVLLKSLALVLLPMALIIKQPDLGTGLVLGAIWLGMTFLAGARWQHLVAVLLAGMTIFGLAWKFDTKGVLIKPYHRNRILILFYPNTDPRGIGYHVKQGRIAIGGGQVTGQGLGAGLQTNSNHVPENHTDSIWTVIAEETGFVGSVALLLLYALLILRALWNIMESEDYLGKLLAGGVVCLFGFHVIVNTGMNLAMLPSVGVPLPLVSYGGSAAITNLAAIGLLMSTRLGRRKVDFRG